MPQIKAVGFRHGGTRAWLRSLVNVCRLAHGVPSSRTRRYSLLFSSITFHVVVIGNNGHLNNGHSFTMQVSSPPSTFSVVLSTHHRRHRMISHILDERHSPMNFSNRVVGVRQHKFSTADVHCCPAELSFFRVWQPRPASIDHVRQDPYEPLLPLPCRACMRGSWGHSCSKESNRHIETSPEIPAGTVRFLSSYAKGTECRPTPHACIMIRAF